MYDTVEEYDEDDYDAYEDMDSDVDEIFYDENNQDDDEYEGEYTGDDSGPDRSLLVSVNNKGSTLDDISSDLKKRMRAFPKETGKEEPDQTMVSLMPSNVQMLQPTLISLENDSFIEGKIYKKGTVLEIFHNAR